MDEPVPDNGVGNTQNPSHKDQASSGGIKLPTRSASVTVIHENAGQEAGPSAQEQQTDGSQGGSALARRDSLEDTKSFYRLNRPTSPPSSSAHRPHSSASRATAGGATKRVRSSSILSSASFRSATSPPRTPAPLPTPRGFLSPKKPASAIRLEKRERSGAHAHQAHPFHTSLATEYEDRDRDQDHQDQAYGYGYQPSHTTGKGSIDLNSQLGSAKSVVDAEDGPEGQHQGMSFGAALALSDMTKSERPSDIKTQGWDRSIGRSITEVSTPPRTAASIMSSDETNLVNRERSSSLDKGKNHAMQQSSANPNPRSTGSNRRKKRKYETFENPLTTFFCGGRLMTGGDNYLSLAVVLVVLLGLSGVWLATTGAWLWVNGREYGLVRGGGVAITIIFAYLFLLCFSSLMASAFRDPGIIPRKLDLDPPSFQNDDWWEAYPRELTVKEGKITVKYCETCESYRPPRSSHCRLCGNCVDGIDHHCSYLHNCVGKRNYFSFLVTITTATIADIYIVVFSALHFSLLCHHDNISFSHALGDSPGAAVSFILGVIVLLPVSFLLWYHLRLLLWNLTTVEQIRATASRSLFSTGSRPDNPFASDSLLSNIVIASIGRPQFPSWLDATGYIEEDKKRAVNPALTDLTWAREGL
ncbi:hypothetical protein I317_03031 [Kwoniella heveanensis CBS 569]|nr:hypothetical protein I317_03031 [Kwoniella heveanensis CBS 569]